MTQEDELLLRTLETLGLALYPKENWDDSLVEDYENCIEILRSRVNA